MFRMKELEENCWLKKMCLEQKLKSDIVSEALQKSGKAIPRQGDGHKSSQGARNFVTE
jgi:putative transposase